jgi:hypothetical protein
MPTQRHFPKVCLSSIGNTSRMISSAGSPLCEVSTEERTRLCYLESVASTSASRAKGQARVLEGAAYATRFFMREADVYRALEKVTRILDSEGIPYVLIGALALNEYGYQRTTVDVDLLLTAEGLAAFKARYLGRGYLEKFPGSRGLRDTETGVNIDVVLAGDYPGDGRPKPVVFPDPNTVAVRGTGPALLPLPTLIELKLASGMTAPHRLRDLADVIELIRSVGLVRELGAQLDPFVQAKYDELWLAAQSTDPE